MQTPPKVPPRTHPVHLRNQRLKMQHMLLEHTLSPDTEPSSSSSEEPCQSRKASSVGFVEIDELLKFQEEYEKRRSPSSSGGLCSSLRHVFFSTSSGGATSSRLPESHINPMFSPKLSISRSFTHLPYPPKKKRKSHLRRVFSCFSIFKQ